MRQLSHVLKRVLSVYSQYHPCLYSGWRAFLAAPMPFSLSLSSCVLFLHLAPIACNEMLGEMARQFDCIVRWRVAIPAYHVFEVIAFPCMTDFAIHGVFSRRMSDIILFQSPVPCLHFFSFSIGLFVLRLAVLSWRLLRRWGYFNPVHRYTVAYAVLVNHHCRW